MNNKYHRNFDPVLAGGRKEECLPFLFTVSIFFFFSTGFVTIPPKFLSAEITIAVLGRNFRPDEPGFRVELRNGGTKYSLALGNLKTGTGFEAIVPVGVVPGTYDLWVINPDDQFDTERSAYTSLAPTPSP